LFDPTPEAAPPAIDLVAPRLTRRGSVIDGDSRRIRKRPDGQAAGIPR
jgi:hypothetical protein